MPRAIAAIKAFLTRRRNTAEQPQEQRGYGRHGYDPNQPRVPAGNPRGGQWTRGRIVAAVLAASRRPPRPRLPGWAGVLLELGLIAIEIFRNLPGWDLFGGLQGGTVAHTVVDGIEIYGANSESRAYTAEDDARAHRMRSTMLRKYPEVMNTVDIGKMPNNVLFHAEATVLLRAADKGGGTLAGKSLDVIVDRKMCNWCRDSDVLPKLGLELGNPTVRFIDKSGTVKTMRNGKWG